jgi:2-oxoglutarate ferredoxin oxidoreductase subunit alpha
LNGGQLARVLRAEYLVDAIAVTKIEGLPFMARQIEARIEEVL